MAQGLPKDETHNWDEDELLELVVAQFGARVLLDEWDGVTEVEPAGLYYPSPKKTEWFLTWHNRCDHVREQLLSLSEK